MAFTKYTNLDFDQIKESIKDYLRANSDFTGFDFEGSNFSVLIDTLAYNAYINSINANMVVNESQNALQSPKLCLPSILTYPTPQRLSERV